MNTSHYDWLMFLVPTETTGVGSTSIFFTSPNYGEYNLQWILESDVDILKHGPSLLWPFTSYKYYNYNPIYKMYNPTYNQL